METVTIWRLEDSNGYGAFRGDPCLIDRVMGPGHREHDCNPLDFPAPTDDREAGSEMYHFCKEVPYSEGRKYYFGFRSIDQYRGWFSCENFMMDIEDHGGVLCEYVVPREYLKEGHYQCIFKMSRAQKIREMSPVV